MLIFFFFHRRMKSRKNTTDSFLGDVAPAVLPSPEEAQRVHHCLWDRVAAKLFGSKLHKRAQTGYPEFTASIPDFLEGLRGAFKDCGGELGAPDDGPLGEQMRVYYVHSLVSALMRAGYCIEPDWDGLEGEDFTIRVSFHACEAPILNRNRFGLSPFVERRLEMWFRSAAGRAVKI